MVIVSKYFIVLKGFELKGAASLTVARELAMVRKMSSLG